MNIVDLGVMPYSEALAVQLECHERVRQGEEDTLFLVEHPPVITFGRHGGEENLLLGRAELAARGIRVFAYMPGMIETELTRGRIEGHRETMTSPIPLNRLGTPEDLAPVLVMLTSDLAGYVTGCTVEISGGKFCVQNPHFAWAAEN